MSEKISDAQLNKVKQAVSESYTENQIDQESLISLHCHQNKYNLDQQKLYVSLDKDLIASGGIAKLPPAALKVLLIIAAHTDREGYSWISQERIGELVGLCRQQVGKIINTQLINKEYDGRVFLKGMKIRTAYDKTNYFYHPVN